MMGRERKYFGTDGVRGETNREPLTPEFALRLGQAVAIQLRRHANHSRVVIGKDTRLSGYMFENALSAGICAMGGDVMFTGPLPTPGIAFITHSMRFDAGVVISASHNPFGDNGIKLFGHDGYKLADEDELAIEDLIDSTDLISHRATPGKIGKAVRLEDARGRYIVRIKSALEDELTLEGLKIVVDCGNGAAYATAPQVFEELGAQVIRLSVGPNGRNINDGCGAMHPEAMAAAVVEHGAQLGIALDGDADRCIVSDEKGHIVDGDHILAMCALDMRASGQLATNHVVATVMSNLGLEIVLRENGLELLRTAVGDRYVVERMRAEGHNLGGEQSGHMVFTDYATTGDGTLAGLRVASLMLRSGKPVSELARVMTMFPQINLSTRVPSKPPLESLPETARLIAEAERELAGRGRVLLRYSGTEPKIRVMVEGEHQDKIRAMAERITEAIVAAITRATP
jgi:phosphoglucosamine mutase